MKMKKRKNIWLVIGMIIILCLGSAYFAVGQPLSGAASNTVRLSCKEKKVQAGKSFRLKVLGGKDLNVRWYSLNQDIATVDEDGLVKGIIGGETKIVANLNNGFAEFECRVIVYEKEAASISVKGASGKHFPGESVMLTAKLNPSDAKKTGIFWRSLNPEIATVSNNGVVKCIAAGTARIEASVKTSKKTVVKAVKLKVTAPFLKLKKSSLSIKTGEAVNPIAVTYCTGASITVAWSSENPEIAQVDEKGKITGKGVGKTYIFAKYNNIEAKCKVTVRTCISRISLKQRSLTLAPGASQKIEPVVSYSLNTGRKIEFTWTSSKEEVATVDSNGNVTAAAPGTAKITVEAEGKKTTCTVYVKN